LVDALHMTLVIAFVLVTGLLFVLTLVHRLRVRRVLVSWRAVRPGATPAWPILFLALVAVMFVYSVSTAPDVPVMVFSGYLAGGLLWLASSVVAGGVLVTEFGIVRELGRAGEVLAWMQIGDYFEVKKGKRVHFVFIYTATDGERRRLQLTVPSAHVARFRRIVRARLDERIEAPLPRSVGRQATEG
jgi:hypothetical protein